MHRNIAMMIFITLLVSTIVFIGVFILTYFVACAISPPYVEWVDGERHGVMPIGQTFIAFIVASISSIVCIYLYYKKFKRKPLE